MAKTTPKAKGKGNTMTVKQAVEHNARITTLKQFLRNGMCTLAQASSCVIDMNERLEISMEEADEAIRQLAKVKIPR